MSSYERHQFGCALRFGAAIIRHEDVRAFVYEYRAELPCVPGRCEAEPSHTKPQLVVEPVFDQLLHHVARVVPVDVNSELLGDPQVTGCKAPQTLRVHRKWLYVFYRYRLDDKDLRIDAV